DIRPERLRGRQLHWEAAASAQLARPVSGGRFAAHTEDRAGPGTTGCQTREREAGRPHPAYVLLALGDARSSGASDSGVGGAPGSLDNAALHALEPCGGRERHPTARFLGNRISGGGGGSRAESDIRRMLVEA